MAVNVSSSCIGCQACIPVCPYEALYMDDAGQARVSPEKCTECGECVEVCPVSALSLPASAVSEKSTSVESAPQESTGLSSAAEGTVPATKYPGEQEVWVFIEQREGQIMAVSHELLGAGRQLAQKLGVELAGVLLGDRVCNLTNSVYEYGADRVYLVDDPVLRHYRTETYTRVITKLAGEYRPEIILMGATTTGRDLAGAVATELGTGLTADCTGLDIDLSHRLLLATQPAFGGNIMATIVNKLHRPQMATVRPKVMKAAKPERGRRGTLLTPEITLNEHDIVTKVLEIVQDQGDQVDLQDAELIVSGGRGLGDKAGFEKICYSLAAAIGARVGGSRAAVEAGWIEQKFQVGQTGVTVAPKIYFALGISGAIQHLVGIRGSDVIIAINTDPDAPIFKECTYGIVGDAFKIVPLLIEPLIELLSRKKAVPVQHLTGQEGINCA